MNIRRIIKEEIDDSLDWVKNLDTYYKVEQLEVGKTYEFVPDYSIMGKYDGLEDAPEWLSSYDGQKLYIIKQEPNDNYPKLSDITFKNLGNSNKMVYDGKYTKISHTSRLFLWGKFKEVENPIIEF